MTAAVSVLEQALVGRQNILIVGDFDADGATSCALMVAGFTALGATRVDYLVPDRFRFGYGLTPEIVDASREFEPAVIVTVDNGISSIEGVARANSLGIQVVITDHHLSGEVLPDAAAIVNPNQPGCTFESKALAGVGVAFYVLMALRSRLRDAGWFAGPEPNLAELLDLVALGTIADVVPMDRNNRILVSEGLRRIRAGRARPGINALIALTNNDTKNITSTSLAFGIAPRLNAAGRLENMSLGIECLLAEAAPAQLLATRLNDLNEERKSIELDMKIQAEQYVEKFANASDSRVGVSLYHPDWHQGVVGIVASRIKDKIHRPVIAFARAGDQELKGSGRSIPGLHIRDALDTIAARNPGLLIKFGGHAMAAGLSIAPADFDRFSELFDVEAARWLGADELEQTLVSDGEIEAEISLRVVREVLDAAPWGQGFPEPLFDGEFEVLDQRIVGQRHLKLKLRPCASQQVLEAIAFNHDRLLDERTIRLAYRLDINHYRGRESVQLIIECADLK